MLLSGARWDGPGAQAATAGRDGQWINDGVFQNANGQGEWGQGDYARGHASDSTYRLRATLDFGSRGRVHGNIDASWVGSLKGRRLPRAGLGLGSCTCD